MQLGLLADIHEDAISLRAALALFARHGVEQVVVLGDLVETCRHIEPIIHLLQEAGATGVWGNHELGFCHEPDPEFTARYPESIVQFFRGLTPRWETGRYLATHALPTVDPTDPLDYYSSQCPENATARERCFTQHPGRVMLMGHYHRWLAATPEGVTPWAGECPLDLGSSSSWLIVLAALMDGWCATLDTHQDRLIPHRVNVKAKG
jgi:hypothetical protein